MTNTSIGSVEDVGEYGEISRKLSAMAREGIQAVAWVVLLVFESIKAVLAPLVGVK